MSTTDEEATSFFRRSEKSRVAAAGGSVHRSASKWLPPRPADTDSSSDIEFVGTSSAVKQRTGNDPKGKGRATEQGRPAARKNASGAAPTRRARRSPSRLSSSSFGSSSDDGDGHRPTSGQMLPSATHIADSGATLRALARDKGWQGQSPPPHAKRRTEAAPGPARKRKQKQSDPSSEPSDLSDFEHRRGRDASTSTDQTTISDRSSSFRGKQRKTAAESVSGPTTKLTTAKRTATSNLTRAKPRQKRGSKAASPSPSPEVDLDNLPPPPESFWGVDTSLSKSGAAVKKHRHGEATDRLKSLSEQRSLLVLPDDDDEDEPRDEIALADSGSSSAGEEARYELTTVKSKREKEEALARLRAKRGKQSVELVARVSTPRAESRDAPAKGKGKGTAVPTQSTASCPLCSLEVPLDELEAHTNQCLDGIGMDEDFEPTPAQAPVARPSRPAFRPAGTAATALLQNAVKSHSKSAATAAVAAAGGRPALARPDNLATALFPSSPMRKRVTPGAASLSTKRHPAAAFGGDGGDDQADEDEILAVSPAKKDKGKGKGKSPARPDGYLTGDGYEEMLDVDASLNGTFIDLCADEEDEVNPRPFRGPSRAATAAGSGRRGDGRVGLVNSKFEPGPPPAGSSPPKGSLYISSLSTAYNDGYSRLFAKPAPKGKKARTSNGSNTGYDPDVDDSEAREFDALAPAPLKRVPGIGRGGRGGKRGGNRRGSWSWRGKARGRGGGKRS